MNIKRKELNEQDMKTVTGGIAEPIRHKPKSWYKYIKQQLEAQANK